MSSMTFEELRAQPNGPHKKFYLIKNFRPAILAATDRIPSTLSCNELVAMIAMSMAHDPR